MKIALVTGEFPPLEGGVGAFSKELAHALVLQGHEIHIITSTQARSRPTQSAATLREAWQRINQLREPVERDRLLIHTRGRRWRWSDMEVIADLTVRYTYDIVNIQYQAAAYNMRSPAINFLPWRLKALTKTVVTFHDLRVPYLFPKAGRWRERVLWMMARNAHGVIVTNRPDLQQLESKKNTPPLRRIPIGSNIAAYQPNHIEQQEVRDRLSLQGDEFLLGYFGFLNESKGADTLVQALIKLGKKFRLVFIGGQVGASDSLNNQLFLRRIQQQIDAYQLQDRLHFTGFLSDTRVATYLKTCDIVVLPYKDGVSLRRGTLMAALAHGRPIISTHPPHKIEELTHGENIWLIPPDNPSALVEAIQQLRKKPELLLKLSEGARQTAALFDWASIASQTAGFFEEL